MTPKNWKSFIVAALLLVALPAVMVARAGRRQTPQESSADKNDRKPTQTLKVDVDLVLVNATVTDSLNRYVSGLESEHFRVWEDKIEQKVSYFNAEDVPISIGIIFD